MKHLRYPGSRKLPHGTVYEGSDNYRLGNTGVSRMEELTPKPRQRGKSLSSDFSTSIWIHVLISRPNA